MMESLIPQQRRLRTAPSNVSRRRMSSQGGFERPDDLMFQAIESKHVDGGSSGRRDASDLGPGPAEVVIPSLAPRVKERLSLKRRWVAPALPGTFPQRTVDTGEREIGESGFSPCSKRSDVINVKGRGLPETRQAAVFTAAFRSGGHLPPQIGRKRHPLWRCRFRLSTEFQNGQHARQLREAFGLFFLGGGQPAFPPLLIQQEMKPVIQRLRETQLRQIGGHRNGELNCLTHDSSMLRHSEARGNDGREPRSSPSFRGERPFFPPFPGCCKSTLPFSQ